MTMEELRHHPGPTKTLPQPRETSSLDCEGCVIILGWWFVGPERQRRRDAA